MSFFTEAEKESLRLARMSLHIVGGDDEFQPQPELVVEHDDFILALIINIASDSIYRFSDISTTRDNIEILARRERSFEAGAQALAADFCRFHNRARDGVFFVFELATDDDQKKIYALMKYDFNQALELIEREGASGLRRIIKAFVHDKSAIQKAAIVRTIDGKAEEAISTRDRMGRPAPLLTDFFIEFLQVARDRSDSQLTKDVKDVVRSALNDHSDIMPPGGLAEGVSKAFDVLRNAPEINESVIHHAVWVGAGQPDNEQSRSKLNNSTVRLIRKKKLDGIAFRADQPTLGRSLRRLVRTREGITIEYDTALEGGAIQKIAQEDGSTQFIVTTREFRDGVVTETAGPSRRRT